MSTIAPPEVRTRPATLDDVDDLVELQARAHPDEPANAAWRGACHRFLFDGLALGDLLATVVEVDGAIAACGIASVQRWLPSPSNPSGLVGRIGAVALDPRPGLDEHELRDRIVAASTESLRRRGITTTAVVP